MVTNSIDTTFLFIIIGNTFSGVVTDPSSISDGPVNIKLTSNCISMLCPIKETSIKTWLLRKVTSFGQCGGILTFETCPNCCDTSSSVTRCSINLIQEKPTIILNILERAIRSNPSTSEIHYERSILGDIYHCGHDCTQPGRLMPAYSDPNIFSSGLSFSPPARRTPLASISIEVPPEHMESNDSGLPGTPQPEELVSTGIPSPTASYRSNPVRSPRHQARYCRSPSEERNSVFRRRQSDEVASSLVQTPSSPAYCTLQTLQDTPSKQTSPKHGRVQYTVINHVSPAKRVPSPEQSATESHQATVSVPYAAANTVEVNPFPVNTSEQEPRERRNNYNKLKTLEEQTEENGDVIYDVPNCEPDIVLASSAPAHCYLDTFVSRSPTRNPYSLSPIPISRKASPTGSSGVRSPTHALYTPGMDVRDRDEDYAEAWASPTANRRVNMGLKRLHVPPTNGHMHRETVSRRRLQSSSDALDVFSATKQHSSDDNVVTYRMRPQSTTLNGYDRQLEKANKDFLKRLNEEEEKLSKVLAASRKEKNEELGEEARDRVSDLNRPYMFNIDDLDHDYSDPDTILETCSNLVDYHTSRPQHSPFPWLTTKEPTNNIKGYAYKVTIPFTNTQYDVPRRAAAAPDLTTMSGDAPPKPKRHTSSEHLHFIN